MCCHIMNFVIQSIQLKTFPYCQLDKYVWNGITVSSQLKVKKKELLSPYNMKKSVIRNIFSQKHVLTFKLQFLSFEKIVKLPVRHM